MDSGRPYPPHGGWLWALLAVFLVRVAAQPLAALSSWGWLPPFDAWQSGALPYPALLAGQLVLAGLMGWTAHRVSRRRTAPRPELGRALGLAAGVYFAVMLARLVLGATTARGHWWLDAPLPTVFHLGLAAYLGVYAHFHARRGVAGSSTAR
jgi:hypothetical protein